MTATVGRAAALVVAAAHLVATRPAAVFHAWAGSKLPVTVLVLPRVMSHMTPDCFCWFLQHFC